MARLWHDQGKVTSVRTAGSGLRVVHGGVRYTRSKGGEGVAGRVDGVAVALTEGKWRGSCYFSRTVCLSQLSSQRHCLPAHQPLRRLSRRKRVVVQFLRLSTTPPNVSIFSGAGCVCIRCCLVGSPEDAALTGEALVYFNTQIRVSVFFLYLFDHVSRERHRVALEKIQRRGGEPLGDKRGQNQ